MRKTECSPAHVLFPLLFLYMYCCVLWCMGKLYSLRDNSTLKKKSDLKPRGEKSFFILKQD